MLLLVRLRRVVKLLLLLCMIVLLVLRMVLLLLLLLVLSVEHACNNLGDRRWWKGLVIVLVASPHETEGSAKG